MYTPRNFAEDDIEVLHQVMRDYNFAILFTNGVATHLPFMIDPERGEYGTLIAHMARANPHWKQLLPDEEVLVVFQGAHCYISPQWYPSGSTIPTWNYAAVHAYGKPKLVHELSGIKSMLQALLEVHEGSAYAQDIKDSFSDSHLGAVVGMEIPISRIEGKFKYSQNKSLEDQQGVIDALEDSRHPYEQEIVRVMKQNLARKIAT